jgi:hypothetical protein
MGKGGKGGVRVIQKGPKGMQGMANKTPQEVQQAMMQDQYKVRGFWIDARFSKPPRLRGWNLSHR